MRKETKNHSQLDSAFEIKQDTQTEDEQFIIEALERYLRRASLTRAHPLPRWVMW